MSNSDAASVGAFPEDVYCPKCAYDLRGCVSDQCPECGLDLEQLRSGMVQVPWSFRREKGLLKTFWSTIWFVMRPQDFARVYSGSPSYKDARRFQALVVFHVYLPILALTVATYVAYPPEPYKPPTFQQIMFSPALANQQPDFWDSVYYEMWPVVIEHAFLLLFLFAATGLPSYFFHPPSVNVQRQNAAVAMSYYVCGPLAVILPGALVISLGVGAVALMVTNEPSSGVVASVFGLSVLLLAPLCIVAWWQNLVGVMQRIMPQLPRRKLALRYGLFPMWILLAAVLLVALPLTVFYVVLVVYSLIG